MDEWELGGWGGEWMMEGWVDWLVDWWVDRHKWEEILNS